MEFSKVPADHRSTDLKTYGMVNMMWCLSPGEEERGGWVQGECSQGEQIEDGLMGL